MSAAKLKINNQYTISQHKEINPNKLDETYNHIKYINKFIIRHSKKNWPRNKQYLKTKWLNTRQHIYDFCNQKNVPVNLPQAIHDDNILTIIQHLTSIKQALTIMAKNMESKLTKIQIKEFSLKRCNDYKTNKKRMINSIIERTKQTIVIDRLLVNIDQNEELITDPNDIMEYTNDHFQNCAGGFHHEPTISPLWQEIYSPSCEIDENIYNDLMIDIEDNEWEEAIKQLPKKKAPGPSGISNKMIAHLGPNMKHILKQFIQHCFKINDIPQDWHLAYIYPIPKPKPWECRLTNTRPITLLETPRKLAVRILNNRLSNIFIRNNIVLKNQYAGLLNGSTFEPLRIINEILQDATAKNNELWILF
jgi:hypothetical protein